MNNMIDLRHPLRGSWQSRGFGRYYLWEYQCLQGHLVNVRCNSYRGKMPEPGVGGIICPQCKGSVE